MTTFDLNAFGATAVDRFSPMRTIFKLWYLRVLQNNENQPSPRDMPHFTTGANPRRVLLLGNGPTHGWGVFSHRFSLTGQLAMALHERRNEAVRVDYVGEEMMNAQTALHWLGDTDLTQYDQIVVVIGWNDAVRLTPDRIWRTASTDLLDTLRQRKRDNAAIVITGIEQIQGSHGYRGAAGQLVQRYADRMNTHLKTYATNHNTAYVDLSPRPANPTSIASTRTNYRSWAEEIANIASPLLPPTTAPVAPVSQNTKFNWVGTKLALGLEPGSRPSPVLLQLEAEAKAFFNVELAQVSILDGDHQYMPNHLGPLPASVPRHLTYCDVASKQKELLIVPNSKRDERFNTNPYLDHAGLPFYVGQPLFSLGGEVVGTFCLLAAIPRPKWTFRRKKFEHFAALAQQEIWRLEITATNKAPEFDI